MGRHSPNLYELLKQAGTRPPNHSEVPPTPDPVRPPVDPNTATATLSTPQPPSEPTTPSRLHVPSVPKPPTSLPSSKPRLIGLGERTVTLTYNSAAFVTLIVLGIAFLAYAIGVRVGRASSPPAPEQPQPVVSQPLPTTASYTVLLKDWPARTSQERLKAQDLAAQLKKLLDSRQLNAAKIQTLGEADSRRVVLTYGQFSDVNSTEATTLLATLRDLRRSRTQDPEFTQAKFVRTD